MKREDAEANPVPQEPHLMITPPPVQDMKTNTDHYAPINTPSFFFSKHNINILTRGFLFN